MFTALTTLFRNFRSYPLQLLTLTNAACAATLFERYGPLAWYVLQFELLSAFPGPQVVGIAVPGKNN